MRRYRFRNPAIGQLAAVAERNGATMAGAPVQQLPTGGPAMDTTRQQLNQLIDDVELLRAQYVLHQHAALNAAPSTNTVLAVALKASKVTIP